MNTETSLYKITRFVWYIFGALELLLAFRFVLHLLGANPSAPFSTFIYTLTQPFLMPFQFVFRTVSTGTNTLELSTLLAIVVYWVLSWGIVKLLLMNRPVSTGEARQQLEQQDIQ